MVWTSEGFFSMWRHSSHGAALHIYIGVRIDSREYFAKIQELSVQTHVCKRLHMAFATHQHCMAWIQQRRLGIAASLVLACTMTERKQLIHCHVLLVPR